VFSGGCVVERFGPDAARQAEFASTASLGLGFVTRDELRQTLRQHSRDGSGWTREPHSESVANDIPAG
jgi:hypothetical protein